MVIFSWLSRPWLRQPKTGLVLAVSSIGAGMATLGWHFSPSPSIPEETQRPRPSPSSPRSLSTSLVLPEWRSSAPLVVPAPIIPEPLPPGQTWSTPGRSQSAPVFIDVPAHHWIHPILQELGQRQLLKGFPDESFRPEASMTRAELAAQLAQLTITNSAHVNSSNTGQAIPNPSYRDVDPQHWAYRPIQSVVQTGYMTGYPDGSFRPDQPLTRLQVVVSLVRGLGLKGQSQAAQVLKPYEDRQNVPDWGAQALAAALEAGLVTGRPGSSSQLEPSALATRAEVMAMVHAVLVYTGELKPIAQP